jgi:hypothetical protein
MPIDARRLDDALDRAHALEARLDLSQREIESDARRMTGLYGAGGRIPTSGQVVKGERQQGWKQALASRGGKIPGPSQMREKPQAPTRGGAQGKACGRGWIASDKECHGARGPNQLGALLRKRYSKGVQVREAGGRLIVSGLQQGEENEMSVMEQAGLYAARKGLRVVRE